jgi:hypothetical protein
VLQFFPSRPPLIYLFFQRISLHSQGLLLRKQALWFVIMSIILVGQAGLTGFFQLIINMINRFIQ